MLRSRYRGNGRYTCDLLPCVSWRLACREWNWSWAWRMTLTPSMRYGQMNEWSVIPLKCNDIGLELNWRFTTICSKYVVLTRKVKFSIKKIQSIMSLSRGHTSADSPFMKPHLKLLDHEFHLDLHHIRIHELFREIRENVQKPKMLKKIKKNLGSLIRWISWLISRHFLFKFQGNFNQLKIESLLRLWMQTGVYVFCAPSEFESLSRTSSVRQM